MSKWKQALIMAGCVSIGSQVYVNVFTDGFIITLAVVLLGIFMYQYDTLHPIKAGLTVAVASPMFRGIILFLKTQNLPIVFFKVYPDVAFYCAYGIFFYFLCYKRKKKNYTTYFIAVTLCDFLSNMVEMLVRNGGHLAEWPVIQGLLFIALGRTAVILAVIICLDSYKSLLSKEEHEERYKKLMIMASVFKSEVYFMNKNMVEIEDVMKKAFSLYKTMEQEGYPKQLEVMALDIAKDVHEIKKDYIRVIQGLQDNFLSDLDFSGMKMKDILHILDMDIGEQVRERKQDVTFSSKARVDFGVADHFSLMSVLRNLVVNSIDSIGGKKNGMVRLDVFPGSGEDEEFYIFNVTDNGPGIPEGDMEVIFDPGYSTKFDSETGDISRGVGLTLVRDMVRDKFHGRISVESKAGVYTKFQIKLPKRVLEGGLE